MPISVPSPKKLKFDVASSNPSNVLKFLKISSKAQAPTKGSPLAAGYDLYSATDVVSIPQRFKHYLLLWLFSFYPCLLQLCLFKGRNLEVDIPWFKAPLTIACLLLWQATYSVIDTENLKSRNRYATCDATYLSFLNFRQSRLTARRSSPRTWKWLSLTVPMEELLRGFVFSRNQIYTLLFFVVKHLT